MAEKAEDLTITWTDDEGTVVTKELDKLILSKGAWTTIMYLYQDINRKSGEYGPQKVRIQRYQKYEGQYRPRSKFNISSSKQARKILEGLHAWFDEP